VNPTATARAAAAATLVVDSPVGRLRLITDGAALTAIELRARGPAGDPALAHPVLRRAARQLAAYFAGRRRAFDLPLAPQGTPFQRAVWTALLDVPYAATASYADIARRIGRPTAVRAVGAANGANPLPIVVPCHRVIGSDGRLTGYAGGLGMKETLLRLEGGAGI